MTRIFQAVPDDIPTLVDFQCKMAKETEDLDLDPAIVRQGVTAVMEDPSKGTYYVAKDGNRIAGCLLTTPEWSEWRNGTVLWIQSVYIDHAYRKQGIFRSLYSFVQDLVHTSDELRGIRLYVEKTNVQAQHVYEAIGMDGDHYQLFEWMK